MDGHVLLHDSFLGETFPADGAAVGSLSGVGSHVYLQVGAEVSFGSAHHAGEQFLSFVHPDVSHQKVIVGKCCITLGASLCRLVPITSVSWR